MNNSVVVCSAEVIIRWLGGKSGRMEVRLHDAMSSRPKTAATTLRLVSCSGTDQIYHGDGGTEQENTTQREREDGGKEGTQSD